MNLFTRYFLWSFLKTFLLVLVGTCLVFIVLDFVGNIRMWLNRNWADTGEYYLNYVPHIVFLIMPIALLMTVTAVVGNMARHLELVAVKSAGLSIPQALAPILFIGLLVTGGIFLLGEYVLPDANHRRLELAQPANVSKKVRRIKDLYNFIYVGSDHKTFYFRHYSASSRMGRDAVLLFFTEDGKLKERIDADRMKWVKGSWQLSNGVRRRFLSSGVRVEKFKTRSLRGKLEEDPSDIINERYTADEMNRAMLQKRIEALRRTGEKTVGLETQRHFKIAGCFVNFFILLIGAALSHGNTRGGLSKNFGIGLFIAFSYYVLLKFGLLLGDNAVLSPLFAAWFGNMIFAAIAALLLWRSVRL